MVLDPAPAVPLPRTLLEQTDFLTPNETELRLVTAELPEDADMAARIATLTKQERCILEYLIRGKSNKFVAIELDIAESTVKAHVSSILRKLKVHSRTLAVIKAGPLLQLN